RSPLEPTPEAEERFLREARTASRLRHPNLALLHDFALGEDGRAFLVLEYIDGMTLREVLRQLGIPPLPLVLEIGRQVCQALAHLHRQRIVHRDISLANLMLSRDADGRPLVKLIDLGLAKNLEAGSDGLTGGLFLGKLRYASPEQFDEGPVDERSDLYSLGVVLYELLTGRSPIVGHDARSWMAAHLFRPPLSFDESDPEGVVPADLRALVLRTLAKDPGDRIASAEALGRALEEIQARYPLAGTEVEPVFGSPLEALPTVETPRGASPAAASFMSRNPRDGAGASGEGDAPRGVSTVEDALLLRPEPAAEPEESLSIPIPAVAATPFYDKRPGFDDVSWDAPIPRESAGLEYDPEESVPAPPPPRPSGKTLPFLLAGFSVAVILVLVYLFSMTSDLTRTRPEWAPPVTPSAPEPSREASEPEPEAPEPVAPEADGSDIQIVEEPSLVEELEVSPEPPPSRQPEPPRVAQREEPPVPIEREPERVPLREREEETARSAPPARQNRSAQPIRAEKVARALPPPPPKYRPPVRREGGVQPGPGVSPPVPLDMPRFSYPAAARGQGLDVDIRLDLLVDESGRVIEAVVQEGDEEGLGFKEVALAAARKVTFQPATRNDVPVKMWTEMIFQFSDPGRPGESGR
ncbi:MAG TPA: TonB family protein, partial [Thermoanaerobaculia bacterium]